MALFKSTPNLPDAERARIEFHLQQISECIGFDRFKLPVLDAASLARQANQTIEQLKVQIGNHLGHDVGGIKTQTIPMQLEKVGGGG